MGRSRGTKVGALASPAVIERQDLEEGNLVDRACPACSRVAAPTDAVVVAPIPATSIDQGERALYWRGFRSRSSFFDYARCGACGLLFCPKYFSPSALEGLYSSMPDNTAGADPETLRRTQQSYIEFLAGSGIVRGTYLEIGPDIGLSTQAACVLGKIERVVLVEPNRAVHGRLRESVGATPVEIVAEIEELGPAVQAETAVLIHVLDHLVDPVGFLTSLKGHLAPGARALFVVHSEASVLRKLLGVRWPPFTLQHPQLFSPATLTATLARAGYTVEAVRPTTNFFPLPHAVRTAVSLVGLPTNWTMRLPAVEIPLRLGNIMAVASI